MEEPPDNPDDIFVISSTDHSGRMEFFGLEPASDSAPVESFHARLVDEGIQAQGSVDTHMAQNLTEFFADLAIHWSGWVGNKSWASLEGELTICCAHDCRGHVTFTIELRSGPYPRDWRVRTVIPAEPGQLDRIARDAVLFFAGRSFR